MYYDLNQNDQKNDNNNKSEKKNEATTVNLQHNSQFYSFALYEPKIQFKVLAYYNGLRYGVCVCVVFVFTLCHRHEITLIP